MHQIWGGKPHTGFALGCVNGSVGDSGGFSWGLFSCAQNANGVAWGWMNCAARLLTGWQSTWLFNYCEKLPDVAPGSFIDVLPGSIDRINVRTIFSSGT